MLRAATRTLAVLGALAVVAAPAHAVSTSLVIAEVFGGGGNAGAPYQNDYILLFNRGASTVNLATWSVQYAAVNGSSWQKTDLSGTIAPGQYYLVQEAAGAGNGVALPTPDAIGSIAMSATGGKVVLLNINGLIPGGLECVSGDEVVIDILGYGNAVNCWEGAPLGLLSNTTAAQRASQGCVDTDTNASDFSIVAPSPRNSASPINDCNPTPTDDRTWGAIKVIYR